MIKVTAENLTEDEIRKFYKQLDPDVDTEAVLRLHCSTALMPDNAMSAAAFPLAKSAARNRIADAINTRKSTKEI